MSLSRRKFFFLLFAIVALFQVASIFSPHIEGDELVYLYDDMQYTRRDWRNRNQIKIPQGLQWLTVPVKVQGKYHQIIRETEIEGVDWTKSHWKSLCQNFRHAKHFNAIAQELEPLYLQTEYSHLSQLNRTLIEWVYSKLDSNQSYLRIYL